MKDSFIDILVVTLIKGLMELHGEGEKGMDESRWQGMTPPISTTFNGEEENNTIKLFIIDFIRFTNFKKIRNVLGYGCSILTIKL